ncbi:sulfurtransferase [Adhaeribacter swui]|uniref:Sulfurtransferase n=1 Tax=Adhaeribacter swui TaxID=2086471 RepID=A0A7G7GAQ0_9BACT|nr:sulfurtransferase [Adhaeribacter swui]QNF34234.1 sulfurtransferase [Adhaeribacter swui]
MNAIINPEELVLLQQSPQLVLVDARSGPESRANYQQLHLQGARFVDLEQELSHKKASAAEGGRHPLPDINQFAQVLAKLGITPDSQVIVYDDKNGANAAARFWWMLRAVGHEKVQVLNGGIQAALAAGYPTSSGEETPAPVAPYPVSTWQLATASLSEVEKAAADPQFLVIDVREPERYRGEKEPIDLVAGHIPGAVNIPFSTNLDPNGFFLPAEELKAKYTEALGNREPSQVIVHCGSGVTACHTLLAMAEADLDIPVLYVGSWSEWSRNNKTIATQV